MGQNTILKSLPCPSRKTCCFILFAALGKMASWNPKNRTNQNMRFVVGLLRDKSTIDIIFAKLSTRRSLHWSRSGLTYRKHCWIMTIYERSKHHNLSNKSDISDILTFNNSLPLQARKSLLQLMISPKLCHLQRTFWCTLRYIIKASIAWKNRFLTQKIPEHSTPCWLYKYNHGRVQDARSRVSGLPGGGVYNHRLIDDAHFKFLRIFTFYRITVYYNGIV